MQHIYIFDIIDEKIGIKEMGGYIHGIEYQSQ